MSETITDIGNTLLVNDHWDHQALYDKISDTLEQPENLPASNPFAQARDLAVGLPANNRGKIDIFIDDSTGVAPDIGETPLRVSRAIPLAIWTLARPPSSNDIIPRKDIISLKKLQAEGRLSEVKTVLGWTLNTRNLTIALPEHKVKE
jgi:hypothetical protein